MKSYMRGLVALAMGLAAVFGAAAQSPAPSRPGDKAELASERDIYLPDQLSTKKVGDHRNLSEENGRDFDKTFIKMIIADHERDLKLFKKAAQCNDTEVSAFAKRYLPLIQSDLEKIKKIKLTLDE